MIRAFLLATLLSVVLVAGARADKPKVAVYAATVGPAATAINKSSFDIQEVTREVEGALRATRRFEMYERNDEVLQGSVMREQEFGQSGLALGNAAEFGKMHNVQLIVQPMITEYRFGSSFKALDMYPGKYNRVDSGHIALTLKVLDTTTGEIKYQIESLGDFRHKPVLTQGKSGKPAARSWTAMVEDASRAGALKIVNAVFPIQVMRDHNGQIYLNTGEGAGLQVGDIREVFSVGEPLIDPATGENLGSTEDLLGEIEITKITPKFSVATPIGDFAGTVKPGDIVR
jgi:curli biogenesis system outer membrane secretion channel CsgG